MIDTSVMYRINYRDIATGRAQKMDLHGGCSMTSAMIEAVLSPEMQSKHGFVVDSAYKDVYGRDNRLVTRTDLLVAQRAKEGA